MAGRHGMGWVGLVLRLVDNVLKFNEKHDGSYSHDWIDATRATYQINDGK